MHETVLGKTRLTLVIPAYQESAGIAEVIEESESALEKIGLLDFEILIVDDGSTDSTFEVASKTAQKFTHTRVIKLPKNCGYGKALRTGFEAARFEKVAFTDADNQFFLEDLIPLIHASQRADIAAGYRFDRQDPKLRIFLSRGYNHLVHSLMQTQVRDCDCALKVFNREKLLGILPESSNFFVNTEMFHRAARNNLTIEEVPVRHRKRNAGQSKVGFMEVPKTLRSLIPYWWSQHFFRAESTCEAKEENGSYHRVSYFATLALLMIFTAVLFGTRMRTPLLEPQEARYAEVPREMLLAEEWVVPLLHGKPYLDKPPLSYWAVMFAYQIAGIKDESARLIPLACGLGCVLALAYWGWACNSAWQGLIGGLVLCLCNRFVYMGRMVAPDSLLTLWVTWGLCCGYLACQGSRFRPGYWLLSGVFAGLGLLTKGPVSLVIIYLPLCTWCLLEPRIKKPTITAWFVALTTAVSIFMPWFVLIMQEQPDFLAHFFWGQNLQRFVAPIDHEQPFWFYLPQLFVGTLPWGLVIPALIINGMRPASKQKTGVLGGFTMLAATISLIFFSIGISKRPIYLLPVLPPLALGLGCWIWSSIQPIYKTSPLTTLLKSSHKRIFDGIGLMFSIGLILASIAFARGMMKPAVAIPSVMIMSTALGCWIILKASDPSKKASLALGAFILFFMMWGGIREILPSYNNSFSIRGHLREYLKTEKKIPEIVVCYPHAWDSVPFYLPNSKVLSFHTAQKQEMYDFLNLNSESLVLVKTGRFAKELMEELPVNLEFKPNSLPGSVTIGWVRRKTQEPLLSQISE